MLYGSVTEILPGLMMTGLMAGTGFLASTTNAVDSVDLDYFRQAARYTGSKVQSGQGNLSNVQQLLGICENDEWMVLNNSATHERLIPGFYQDTDTPDLGSEELVSAGFGRLG